MSLWMLVLMGIVQGVTEFLPISSDGHLAVVAMLGGVTNMSLTLTVLLHVGTLLATLIVFRDDVKKLLATTLSFARAPRVTTATDEGRTWITIVAASVPTAIIGLAIEDAVEAWSSVPWIVALCLLGSAAAVASTRFTAPTATNEVTYLPLGRALFLGAMQGLAVLPGLSRSGTTIAVAMALGLAPAAAFRLSFLLSLPAVAGAVVLKVLKPEVLAGLGLEVWIGAVVSFVVGYASLLLLRGTISRGRFWAFALYLVPLAAFVLWLGMR